LPFDSDGERRRERITRSCGNREALPLDRLWKAEQIGGGKGISRQLSPAADTLGKCYAVSGTHRLGHSGESLLQAVSGRNFRVARHPSSMEKVTSSNPPCGEISSLRRYRSKPTPNRGAETLKMLPSKSAVNVEFFPAKAVSLALFEHVFVLRVSDGQCSLRSGAHYKLKTHGTGYSGDEGNCTIRVFASSDLAFPFAKIKDGRSA